MNQWGKNLPSTDQYQFRDLSNASRISQYTLKSKPNKFCDAKGMQEVDSAHLEYATGGRGGQMHGPKLNHFRKSSLSSLSCMSNITSSSSRGYWAGGGYNCSYSKNIKVNEEIPMTRNRIELNESFLSEKRQVMNFDFEVPKMTQVYNPRYTQGARPMQK